MFSLSRSQLFSLSILKLITNSPRLCTLPPSSPSFHLSSLTKQQSKEIPSNLPFQPHPITHECHFTLHLLRHCNTSSSLKKILSLLIVKGLLDEETLVPEITILLFHSNLPKHALCLLQSIRKPSLTLQNFLVRNLSDHGLFTDLLSVYKELQDSGCGSDNNTFPFAIKACAALLLLPPGKEIHCHVLRKGYDSYVVIQTALVDMYAKNGLMEISHHLFDGIPHKDLVSWNALLSGYSLNGLDLEALKVFWRIRAMGFNPNLSTFVSVIPVCTRLGVFWVGKSIHGLGVKCGVSLDESFVPTLISMYSSFEELPVSRTLFCLLPKKNLVVWNAIISACSQNGEFDEAFKKFRVMHQTHIKPNIITFVSVLPSCGNLDNIRYGESIHAGGIKHGLDSQTGVSTALVSMYSKFGDLEAAQLLFCRMIEKNLLSWNSIISCYVKNGFPEMGLDALCEMQFRGLKPDSVSISIVVPACTILKDTFSGKAAHAYSLRNGFDVNLNVSNALLDFYADCNRFNYSLTLFNKMSKRDVISWNTLLSGFVRKGDKWAAVCFLQKMQQEQLKFDLVTIISVLPIFRGSEDLIPGMSIHGHAIKNGCGSDISLLNAVISMYSNCGDLDAACLLFENMPFRSVITWNVLMTGFRHYNLFKEVMILFDRMKMENWEPNSITLLNILPVCQSELQGKSIHAYLLRTDTSLECSLITSLILMYDRFQNLKSCLLLVESAEKRNVVVWNSIMSVHVRSKHSMKTVSCFREMLWLGMEPDSITILTLVSACVQLGSLDLAKSMTSYVICTGFKSDNFVSNALIDLFARCGDILMAKEIFDEMKEKDVVSWSVIINGYGIHGDGDGALDLLSQMKVGGVEPDDVTFIGALSACSHAGLLDQGRKLFKSMTEEYNLVPRMEHYACMVDLLARVGQLEEAFKFVRTLPIKPSASMLESLAGACRVHGNIELGQEIGRLACELGVESSGSYVVLSNIYAAAGRWGDVGRLRYEMEGGGLRKVPGFSLIG